MKVLLRAVNQAGEKNSRWGDISHSCFSTDQQGDLNLRPHGVPAPIPGPRAVLFLIILGSVTDSPKYVTCNTGLQPQVAPKYKLKYRI